MTQESAKNAVKSQDNVEVSRAMPHPAFSFQYNTYFIRNPSSNSQLYDAVCTISRYSTRCVRGQRVTNKLSCFKFVKVPTALITYPSTPYSHQYNPTLSQVVISLTTPTLLLPFHQPRTRLIVHQFNFLLLHSSFHVNITPQSLG